MTAKTPSSTRTIESQLTSGPEPVIGLYLHVAYWVAMSTFESRIGHGEITANQIGVLAHLATRPGMSQAELARLIGIERATVGTQVARSIRAGFVRRDVARHDGRSYELFLTRRGMAMLEKLRKRIPAHERAMFGCLSAAERRQLRRLLDKVVNGQFSPRALSSR